MSCKRLYGQRSCALDLRRAGNLRFSMPRTKGRTVAAGRKTRRPVSVKCYCGGSASARGHGQSEKHRAAARVAGNPFEANGPVTRALPTVLRDPYGRNRDWDAEQREYLKARMVDEAAERHVLIVAGPLPDAPTVEYADAMAMVTLAEGARRLGVKPVTLRMAIRRGRLIAHKYGRDWLVEESELHWYEMRSLGRVGWPKGRSRSGVQIAREAGWFEKHPEQDPEKTPGLR